MAQHKVELTIKHGIEIVAKDIEIQIHRDGAPLGQVRISRGGIGWLPSGRSKNGHEMEWIAFAEQMTKAPPSRFR